MSSENGDYRKGLNKGRLRSTVACVHCRRSKIKCQNEKGESPCGGCAKSGKQCRYDLSPQQPKRLDPTLGPKNEAPAPERKRVKREDTSFTRDQHSNMSAMADAVLSVDYLDVKMWESIFELFNAHYAAELPFLHVATMMAKVLERAKSGRREHGAEINLVLLGVLALTARYEPTLVKYVNGSKQPASQASRGRQLLPVPAQSDSKEAWEASDFYADKLVQALGGNMEWVSIERTQACLMLGIYRWVKAQPGPNSDGGCGPWMWTGQAIRSSYAQGLNLCDRQDPRRREPKAGFTIEDVAIAKEIRRRTMWSCFIIDRLLSNGRERVSTIRPEDVQTQLPCDETSFRGGSVTDATQPPKAFLVPRPGDAQSRNIDSLLGHLVRFVDAFADISKYQSAGGRLADEPPPTSEQSGFRKLVEKLDSLERDVPEEYRCTTSNYLRKGKNAVFINMHLLIALCRIMLHRQYVPYRAVACTEPTGPIDGPTLRAGQVDPSFWKQSVEKFFYAARDVVNTVELTRDKLPRSPLTLYVIWTAAFAGLYAWHFPQMDVQRSMLPPEHLHKEYRAKKISAAYADGPTRIAFDTIVDLSKYLPMGQYYQDMFHEYDAEFCEAAAQNKVRGGVEDWTSTQGKGAEELYIGGSGEERAHDHSGSNPTHSRGSTVDGVLSVGAEYHAEGLHNELHVGDQHYNGWRAFGPSRRVGSSHQKSPQLLEHSLLPTPHVAHGQSTTGYFSFQSQGAQQYAEAYTDQSGAHGWHQVRGGSMYSGGAEMGPSPGAGNVYLGNNILEMTVEAQP